MHASQQIVMLDQLGNGLTSTVSRCQVADQQFAIKVYKETCTLKSRIKEVQALSQLKDCHVIQMTAFDPQYSWLLLELLYKKDLFDFVANEKKCFIEPVAKYLFKQLATVISKMHQKKFVHRDIKLENILLDPVTLEPRISDLGFAENTHHQLFSSRSMGTAGYMSPELQAQLLDGSYRHDRIEVEQLYAADVFALGVCLFILTFAHPPFQSTRRSDSCPYWRCICAGKWETFWKACERHKAPRSKELKNLLQAMLQPNLKLRPTMAQVLCSPWLQEGAATQDEYFHDMALRKQSLEAK